MKNNLLLTVQFYIPKEARENKAQFIAECRKQLDSEIERAWNYYEGYEG